MLDFTRQQRVLHRVLHPNPLPPEQDAWMALLKENPLHDPTGVLNHQYAHACPLTDKELAVAVKLNLCGQKRVDADGMRLENAERLSYRFKKEFKSFRDSKLPLLEVPEIELALQAMLACSLHEPYVHNIRMSPLKELVSSYWTEAMSIFTACVNELQVSTCPPMQEFRTWTATQGKLTPIHLIPVGDVNHKRARFFAYPNVWDVFATAFDPAYAGCPSFYCEHPNATDAPATRPDTAAGAAARVRAEAQARVQGADETESD